MRVAFDLDNTLIGDAFPFEPAPRGLFRRLWSTERLRLGTSALMFELRRAGHEVWIYTTSYRSTQTVHATFWAHRLKVARVINQRHHVAMRAKLDDRMKMVTKYPPAWQIDLIIDDSEVVVEEGRRFGFHVVQIRPTDNTWDETVLEAVELLHESTGNSHRRMQ